MTKSAYAAGHFELLMDGHKTSAYLKSVDGGYPKQTNVEESLGTWQTSFKHNGLMKIDPFTIDFGISAAAEILKWIQGSWRDNDWTRRNGQINHADFNLKQTVTHEFSDALITETTFPALDGAAKEPAYMKVKFHPEHVKITEQSGAQLSPLLGQKQKVWTPSAFRLSLQGLEEDLTKVSKIESFTIKQQVKEFYSGAERFPQLIPNKIVFPNLKIQIAAAYASSLMAWGKDVHKGKTEKKAQKSGAIEFLSPDRSKTLFRINLYEVNILSWSMVQANANSDQIKRVQAELSVGRMDLDGKGLGLE